MDAHPFSITMVNRKGGCGKTGTCHQISGCFAHLGYRVLLVDMDPAANLTQGFFGSVATETMPARKTVLSLFDDAYDPDPAEVLLPTKFERITIFPGSHALDEFEAPPPKKAGPLKRALSEFLKEVEGRFDVTIIDCPPNLQLWSWNALVAADFVIVPVQPEDFGAQGIIGLFRN
jgi:chromosome partitioning protein